MSSDADANAMGFRSHEELLEWQRSQAMSSEALSDKLSLVGWLREREQNARWLARGDAGWIEDAEYFRAAIDALEARADSAVPSSHVSDQSAALSDGGSGECVRAPVRDTECRGLDTPERVRFYEHDFYVLSNFSAFRLAWAGLDFDTSEAAYHWEKFPGYPNIRAGILGARSAHDAFKLGEAGKVFRRADWDAVKVDIMRGILRAKAEQHEYVRRKLLATGDRELVEDSWRDDFWGWGPNRDGMNMLGKLWMEVRAELRAEPAPTTASAPANSETDQPKAEGESILREALARPLPELPPGNCTIRLWQKGSQESDVTVWFDAKQMVDYAEAARSALAGTPKA